MDATTDGNGGVEVLDMSIEREWTMVGDAVLVGNTQNVYHRSNIAAQSALMQHHTLRKTCGA